MAGQVESEGLLEVLGEPDLVQAEGVGDVVVLDPGEMPDQPGDGVGSRAGPGVQVVGAEALDGGVDFFLDAAVTVDEDVLGMHGSTIAHSRPSRALCLQKFHQGARRRARGLRVRQQGDGLVHPLAGALDRQGGQ